MLRSVLLAVSVSVIWAGSAYAEWKLVEKKDVMTDAVTREVCDQDTDGNEICFWFSETNRQGKKLNNLWMSFRVVPSQGRSLEYEKYPITRVDSHEMHDVNPLIEIEKSLKKRVLPREFHSEWIMISVQVFENSKQYENVNGMFHQLKNGNILRIRYFLTGGFQRDSSVSLSGIALQLQKFAPSL